MRKRKTKETHTGSWRLQTGEPTAQWREQQKSEEDHEKIERKAKTIPISHYHRIRKPWIILPYGLYYNKELLEARQGDILLFSDKVEREIEYMTPIKFESSFTDYLCRKTYGVRLSKIKERWKANIEFEGYNIKAINEDRVLLIFLKEIQND